MKQKKNDSTVEKSEKMSESEEKNFLTFFSEFDRNILLNGELPLIMVENCLLDESVDRDDYFNGKEVPNILCRLCEKTFESAEDFNDHIQKIHIPQFETMVKNNKPVADGKSLSDLKFELVQRELVQRNKEIGDLTYKNFLLKDSKEEMEKEISELNNCLEGDKSVITDLQRDFQEARKKIIDLKEQIADQEIMIEGYSKETEELKKTANERLTLIEYYKKRAERGEKAIDENVELKTDKFTLLKINKKLSDYEKEASERGMKQRNEIADLIDLLDTEKKISAGYKKELEESKSYVEDLEERNKNLKMTAEEFSEANEFLENKIEMFKSEVQNFKELLNG